MAGGTAKGTAGGAPPRKADPWKVAFIVLLIVALLAAAGYLLLGSRLLVVREVAVSGLHRLDRDEVVRALAVPTGTPLARVDTEAAAERVAGLRLAESARVERGWPAELRVRVEERTPKLAVGAGGGYRLVDQDGVRISDTEALPEEYPLASVRGEVEGNGGIAAAAGIAEALDGALPVRLVRIDARDPAAITLELAGGAEVSWGDGEAAEHKARVLEALAKEHPPAQGRRYDVSAQDMAVVGTAAPTPRQSPSEEPSEAPAEEPQEQPADLG
ncbi:cell division protein FtsQ/DivIB [Nocardiopsis composta]|uniref:Cell division protein FtsQ n=1 Tax=Nocardiopsis composta TaxID=157465 RepID=A0A7W8QSI7_9ACTN|nr:FtsQ-type POTRA domain-containing protein [Nocardiopsis composta]MBB5435793.1 cell division protein FtsQ [Nocardiopsis composta]